MWNDPSPNLESAIRYAVDMGVLIVAGSGSFDGLRSIYPYPAAYEGVIAVGATGETDAISNISGRGFNVDVTAPGENITTTKSGSDALDRYYFTSAVGTPIAASHVAGVLSLLLAKGVTPPAAVGAIYSGAVDLGALGRDDTYGWGRVDACGALNAAGFTCPVGGVTPTPVPTPISTPTPIFTPVVSPRPSPTPTPTPRASSTPTPSPTLTPTPTPTATPTSGLSLKVLLYGRVSSNSGFSSTGVSGTAPLTGVDFFAYVTGTATGTARYRFDCTNDGTFERDTTFSSVYDLCNYQTSGTYTASVRVDRQGLTATDTLTISVK